jgi:hypothetical protein
MNRAAQLDRDIAEALAASANRQPLYGHTNEATAYNVADYPYGFTTRTQARYWLEHKPKKGWRLVFQTLNPKTERWNKPKASTYSEWGGAMFLDGNGHVQWEGIGPYSSDAKILAFVRTFPEAPTELAKIATQKERYLRGRISGELVMTVNKVPQPVSEADIEEWRRELEIWDEIEAAVKA